MARILAVALVVFACIALLAGCPQCPQCPELPEEDTDLLPGDLPGDFVVPASAEPGEPIGDRMTFYVKLRDRSDLTGDFFVVAFYLSPDETWDFDDDLLYGGREQVLLPMTAGERREVSVYEGMSIPAGASLGSYYILAVIDETGKIDEYDESNNVASAPITLGSEATIYGESNVVSVGELGHYIDISFETAEPVTLIDAQWNWDGHAVYLDVDGDSMVDPQNLGVDDHQFHFGLAKTPSPSGDTEQIFGFYAEGFDSGDYFKFTMDLDRSVSSGTPLYDDLEGGTLTLIFSDERVVTATFDVPWDDNPWAATAIIESDF